MLFFVITIFVIGVGTVLNAKDDLIKSVKSGNVNDAKSGIELALQEKFKGRTKWINLNGLAQKSLARTVIKDPGYTVYRLKNGQVMYGLAKRDMGIYADRLEDYKNKLKAKGIEFLYVQLPFKIKDDSYMPPGTHDYGNANAKELLSLLDKKGVKYLDLKSEMEKDGLDWTEQFFYTDHHWRPETGIWASGKIMKRVEEITGEHVNMDYYDLDNYNYKEYKNFMLGTVGRRTGYWYSGLDDIKIFVPKYKTDFDFWGKSKNGVKEASGDFEKTMLIKSNLKRADYEVNPYATYIGKNFARNVIKNRLAKNDLKVFWFSESFSGVLIPFVSPNVKEITTVDLRRFKKDDMLGYVDDYSPDIVVVAYNPSAFSKRQFEFVG